MKKIIAVLMMMTIAFALAACASGSLGVYTDNDGVHAKATGSADGSGTGNITIKKDFGLCVNHIVERGSFHVTATSASGEVVFDKDINDNIADLVEVEPGDYDLTITANKATGTIDVIPYDIEAQAMADATLDENIKEELENAKKN